MLKELMRITTQYLLISRLPVYKYRSSNIVLQTVRHQNGQEKHPIHILNRNELQMVFKKLGLQLMYSDYGSEFMQMQNVPVVLNTYLLKKNP